MPAHSQSLVAYALPLKNSCCYALSVHLAALFIYVLGLFSFFFSFYFRQTHCQKMPYNKSYESFDNTNRILCCCVHYNVYLFKPLALFGNKKKFVGSLYFNCESESDGLVHIFVNRKD